jgi:hypothetical protein
MAPYDAGADTSLPDGFTGPRLPDRRSMTVNVAHVARGGRQAGSAFRRSLSLCIYRVRRPRFGSSFVGDGVVFRSRRRAMRTERSSDTTDTARF